MRRLSTAAACACLLLAAIGPPEASAASSPAKSLSALVRQTKALPASAASKAKRRKLVAAASHARKVAKKKPCSAVADLSRFRRVLRGIKVSKGKKPSKAAQRLAALGPSSVKASQQLLGDKRTTGCGGGQRPSTRAEATTQVLDSDENGMRVRVNLPVLRFVPVTAGGQTWTKLVAPETDSPGAPGTPGIPVVSGNFAVPDGATVKVTGTNATSYTVQGVNVLPAQRDPVDDDTPAPGFTKPPFATPPFTVDKQAYKSKSPVPASATDGGVLGAARDVTIGAFRLPAAQLIPATGTLKVITSIEVRVAFEGGPHQFSPQLQSPWELQQRSMLSTLLNRGLFTSRPPPEVTLHCGEEMLVITNPSTRSTADTFANAKRLQGMKTNVVETGAGDGQAGTTPEAIQTTIRSHLTALGCIRPSYVSIMGDDELVPTFTNVDGTIPSDLPYAKKNDDDNLPDLAVGRILGQDTAQLDTAVAKIINYENNPPTGPMLHKAAIAASFQDDNGDGQEERTFTYFAETMRAGLASRGLDVDRIYTDDPTTTPLKLADGTDLPASLKKPTFAWDGSGADITNAWNDGRFMMIHRDHGWSEGWWDPRFTTTQVDALTNGDKLPVVLSINCSSAAYDYDETSFTQQALTKSGGGAVGVFGDTRDSPTWHNSVMAMGFVDGLLPSVLPGEGPSTKQRVGDALITGKLRLAGMSPPPGDGNTTNEMFLWHYFGDPSMQMWGGDQPRIFVPEDLAATFKRDYSGPPVPDPPPYEVQVTLPHALAGQPISLLRGRDVIGRATAGDGTATIRPSFGDGSPKPGDLQVVMEPTGSPAVRAPVQGVPEPPPPPPPPPPPAPPVDTTLSQQCPDHTVDPNTEQMTISGQLSPGFAGATIKITYTPPEHPPPDSMRHPFVDEVTTNADGTWSDSIDPVARDTSPNNTWEVQSKFDGDAGHNASQSTSCEVQVQQSGG